MRLRTEGYSLVSQASTGLLGANDLLIEDTVALELDGREFHESTFERDRLRDLISTTEGRHVIRVSRRMLRHQWPLILEAIRSCLSARRVGNSGDLVPHPVGKQRSHPR